MLAALIESHETKHWPIDPDALAGDRIEFLSVKGSELKKWIPNFLIF
jgi:hypothetical protein